MREEIERTIRNAIAAVLLLLAGGFFGIAIATCNGKDVPATTDGGK